MLQPINVPNDTYKVFARRDETSHRNVEMMRFCTINYYCIFNLGIEICQEAVDDSVCEARRVGVEN